MPSIFQIGSGYYGLETGTANVSQLIRNRAAKAFKKAFSKQINLVTGRKPLSSESTPNPPKTSK